MQGKKNRSIGKTIMLVLSIIVLFAGCTVFAYPYANGLWMDYALRRDAEEFLSYVYTDEYVPNVSISHSDTKQPEETESRLPGKYPELWQQMQAYNETIYKNGQEGLLNESSYEVPSFTLSDFGLESEVFAVISIPSLDIEMPVYLGATKQHMADGAAHMSQTSLPIGGNNTNCVIAGHRGWKGAAYFLYITQLQKGDIVTITNLWETLTYEVVDTMIISPTNVEAIHIQENRDLLTLLTCHPPATGGRQRYLVFCERIETELEVP